MSVERATCILVLGMHRSGTSALGGVLDALGVKMGSRLIEAAADNQKGFFESRSITSFNENELLPAIHSYWDDISVLDEGWEKAPHLEALYRKAEELLRQEYGNERIFGLKDPRLCVLFPFWKHVFAALQIDLKVILPYRNPFEVAESLHKRNGFPVPYALACWCKHTLLAERYSREYPRVFVTFDQLIGQTEATVVKMEKVLELTFPRSYNNAAHAVDDLLDTSLKHCHTGELPGGYPGFVYELIRLAEETSADSGGADRLRQAYDGLRQQYATYAAFFMNSHVRERVWESKIEMPKMLIEIHQLQETIASLLHSTSWKVTRPLRSVKQWLSGDNGNVRRQTSDTDKKIGSGK